MYTILFYMTYMKKPCLLQYVAFGMEGPSGILIGCQGLQKVLEVDLENFCSRKKRVNINISVKNIIITIFKITITTRIT